MLSFFIDPPFKPSMTEKYGYSFASQLWRDGKETYKKFNYSTWQMYQELTYRLRKDVKFKIGSNKKQLREGVNLIKNQSVIVTSLATYRHGMCTMIQPNFHLHPIDNLKLKIYLKTKASDLPENINLFLISNNAWHGMFFDDWPFFKPAKINLKPSKTLKKKYQEENLNNHFFAAFLKKHGYTIKLSMKEKHYLQGEDNFKDCFSRLVSQFNCTNLCYPLIFNDILNLPACEGYQDLRCMADNFFNTRKQRTTCLKPKKTLIYQADSFYNAEYENKKTSSFVLSFRFLSPMVEIIEEIPEIGFPSLVGSVGGSLGLFIGFSCYTFLSKIVDTFFAYCF